MNDNELTVTEALANLLAFLRDIDGPDLSDNLRDTLRNHPRVRDAIRALAGTPADDPIVQAQHDETGRMWTGPRSQMPHRFAECPADERMRGILAKLHAGTPDAWMWHYADGRKLPALFQWDGEQAPGGLRVVGCHPLYAPQEHDAAD